MFKSDLDVPGMRGSTKVGKHLSGANSPLQDSTGAEMVSRSGQDRER